MNDIQLQDAKRMDQRIRLLAGSIGKSLAKLHALVEEAKQGEIHEALGFPSWTAYLADALTIEVQLDRDQRRELVGYLSGEGMSQRAIATVVNTSVGTVNNDLTQVFSSEQVPELSGPVEAEVEKKSIGLDGNEYPSRRRTQCEIEVLVAEGVGIPVVDYRDLKLVDDATRDPNAAARAVATSEMAKLDAGNTSYAAAAAAVGDTKSGAASEPAKPRRRPITESFRDATWHIGKKAESLRRLADDDRFTRYGQELAHRNLSDLKRARQRLDEVIAELEVWWDR